MIGCLTETTTCVVAKPLVIIKEIETKGIFRCRMYLSDSQAVCQPLRLSVYLYSLYLLACLFSICMSIYLSKPPMYSAQI